MQNEIELQIIETWNINNRINLLLVNEFTEETLKVSLGKRGGRTIGMQLAHLIDVRYMRMEVSAKEALQDFEKVPRDKAHNKKLLQDGF